MNCGKIQRLIQEYVDGEGSVADRAAVECHVTGCAGCRRTLEEAQQLASWMSVRSTRSVSADFDRKLMAAIQQTVPAPRPQAWWERLCVRFEWRLRLPAMVAAGSVATALVAALVVPQFVSAPNDEQRVLLSSALQRHHELSNATQDVNWDAVDASIELSTGSALTE